MSPKSPDYGTPQLDFPFEEDPQGDVEKEDDSSSEYFSSVEVHEGPRRSQILAEMEDATPHGNPLDGRPVNGATNFSPNDENNAQTTRIDRSEMSLSPNASLRSPRSRNDDHDESFHTSQVESLWSRFLTFFQTALQPQYPDTPSDIQFNTSMGLHIEGFRHHPGFDDLDFRCPDENIPDLNLGEPLLPREMFTSRAPARVTVSDADSESAQPSSCASL